VNIFEGNRQSDKQESTQQATTHPSFLFFLVHTMTSCAPVIIMLFALSSLHYCTLSETTASCFRFHCRANYEDVRIMTTLNENRANKYFRAAQKAHSNLLPGHHC
jgi:hypothetical protein